MSKEKIRALLVSPHESPRIVYIEPTMRAFRKLVDADAIEHGGIEAKKLERNVYAMFNKDRFLVASLFLLFFRKKKPTQSGWFFFWF